MAKKKTRREQMRARGARFFTGREEQIEAFELALDAVQHNFEPPYEDAKTAIAISGEGGMGKTTLLWEFERVCRRRDIQSIYLDLRRPEAPYGVVDFIRILRPWFPPTKGRRLIGQEPFAEFDRAYARYMGLEEKLKALESKKADPSAMLDRLADLGSRAAVGLGKDLPLGQTAVALLGEERLEEGLEAIIRGGVGLSRDLLLRIFGKAQDVDFYRDHEEILIHEFAEGVANYVKSASLVILIDSYEEVMDLDIVLRERLLERLPQSVILVFAGRNSIYDNCSLSWRDETHFFELGEFEAEETAICLKKRGIKLAELIETIHTFTNGVPLAVALAANAVERVGDEQAAVSVFSGEDVEPRHSLERRRIIEEVAQRFLSLVKPEERNIIHTCAVLGRFDLDSLQGVLGIELSLEEMERTERYSFIRRPDVDYLFHDTVRTFVLQKLQNSTPEIHKRLYESAATFFEGARADLDVSDEPYENEQWRKFTLEIVYHRLQARGVAGVDHFFRVLADALWEPDYAFGLELLDLLTQPLPIHLESAELLQAGCKALTERDYQKAKDNFETLLLIDEDNIHFRQLVHDTLGDVYKPGRLNQLQPAVKHYEQAIARFEALGEEHKVARTLANIADCYQEWDKYEEAVVYYRQALSCFEALEDAANVADSLWDLGITYRNWGKFPESIEHLTRSRQAYEGLEQARDVASLWRSLGHTYRAWGKYEEAVAHYQEALSRYQALEDEANVADVLLGLGITYRDWGRFPESVEHLTSSRQAYEKLEQARNVASLWTNLGITYLVWGKHEEAVAHCQEALSRYEALEDEANVADVLGVLGITYRSWGKFPESVDRLIRSRQAYEKLEQARNVASVWKYLGGTYRTWGKYEVAAKHYQEASSRYEALEDAANVADSLWELGITYRNWGKFPESVEHLTRSRQAYEELEQARSVTHLWNHLGVTYRNWGKYEEAVVHYQEALSRLEALEDAANVANVLWELGITYCNWGKFPESVEYLTSSRETYERLERARDVAHLWNRLGITYRTWGKYEEAVTHYQEALSGFEALEDEANIADVLLGLGITYRDWGRFPESVEHLTRSRQTYEGLEQARDVASLWNSLGRTYRTWGKYEEAVTHYQEALSGFEALEDEANIADVLLGLGITYRSWGKFPESLERLSNSYHIYYELQTKHEVVHLLRHQALTLARMEKYAEAVTHATEGLELAETSDLSEQSAWCHEALVEVYGACHRAEQARDHFKQAVAVYEALGGEVDIADAKAELGKVERAEGNNKAAEKLLKEALDTYQAFNRPVEIAKTLRELGKLYQAAGQENQAREMFQGSIDLFTRMLMDTEVTATQELLTKC